MLTCLLSPTRCSSSHWLLPNLFCGARFLLLTVASVIASDTSLGQTPEPNPAPTMEAQSVEPQIPGTVNENVTGPRSTSPSSSLAIEPLTRQSTESSPEITPADRRIMSDIQEIRAMLGGGLEREFEEINQTLGQYPGAMVHPAEQSQASPPPKANARWSADDASRRSAATVQEDRGVNATEGDWFSRELGQMVRRRSRLLSSSGPPLGDADAAANQVNSPPRQTAKSPQPVTRQVDTCRALRQCARDLELVAGALEQIDAYDNADTVRREANQLWEKARKSGPVAP